MNFVETQKFEVKPYQNDPYLSPSVYLQTISVSVHIVGRIYRALTSQTLFSTP